jgi:hypothetical protein
MKLLIVIEFLVGSVVLISDKNFLVIGNENQNSFSLTKVIDFNLRKEYIFEGKKLISIDSTILLPKRKNYELISSIYTGDSIKNGFKVSVYEIDYLVNNRKGSNTKIKVESQFSEIPLIYNYIPDFYLQNLPFLTTPQELKEVSGFEIISNEISSGKTNKILIHKLSKIEEIDITNKYSEIFNISLIESGVRP